ncbi:MAG: MsnO8 family LLM class oxidoreductase, partial [Enterococcus faecalis]|nr:MsnO8 family LLM class oxidoreductase [Enterococcus faecalis]
MKISILNLIPRFIDETSQQSINRGLELAKWADGQNFERYWVAEHHNSKSISCSATDLIIGYILENTKRIKVGAGGVMLPNHTPFQVAERYGTLETLYPDRVDLGIGRAPGTDIELSLIHI